MQLKLGAFIRKHPENLVSDDNVEDKIYYQHLAYIKVKKKCPLDSFDYVTLF